MSKKPTELAAVVEEALEDPHRGCRRDQLRPQLHPPLEPLNRLGVHHLVALRPVVAPLSPAPALVLLRLTVLTPTTKRFMKHTSGLSTMLSGTAWAPSCVR